MERFNSFFLVFSLTICLWEQGNLAEAASEDGKLTFLALGDAGGTPWHPFVTKTQKNVARAMGAVASSKHPRFVLGLGDNFYWKGVKDVDDARFNQTFENVFTAHALRHTTWHMIAGNHDYLGNVSAQIAYTKKSKRWHFPHYYYTKVEKIPGTCKTLQIVMIDTTMLCYRGEAEGEKHSKWLEKTLDNSKADYMVVAGHHPVYSVGMHGSNSCLKQKLKPLLLAYDVTAYLSGHDHNLQHIKERDNDIHYFVSGSVSNHNAMQFHHNTIPYDSLRYFNGMIGAFTLLEATPKALRVTFINEHGHPLHTTTICPRRRSCTVGVTPDMIGKFEDSILEAFFGLQEEQERKRRARKKSWHSSTNASSHSKRKCGR